MWLRYSRFENGILYGNMKAELGGRRGSVVEKRYTHPADVMDTLVPPGGSYDISALYKARHFVRRNDQ